MNVLPTIQRRLRIAGLLTGAGLLVQLTTLFWHQASAFLLFAMIGVPLMVGGCAVFLYSLVSSASE
jgi:hypothetical protein